ncbi:putative cell wall protein [Cornus florida]|uniref:putative cell wall protein n=1 Tax=Cornus florida TaxID=4283 RepID=UPI00289672D3|nr:putative cell wall protein [Cornus florida]
MAYKSHSVLAFLLIFNVLLAITVQARDIPTNSKTTDKKLQPDLFIDHDGSVLIPGIGRVMIPPKFHRGYNPFTYNPVTGSSGGSGIGSIGGGSIGSGGGSTGSYVPGGDDTFVPNPGFEVPIPGSGGNVPASESP